MQDKTQENRSEFFKDKVYTQLLSIFVMSLVLVVFSLTLYRAMVLRPGTIYFKTDDSVSVFNNVKLTDPLQLKKVDITYWASQTTASLFNVNYINVVEQIERKSNFFDEVGWVRFKKLLVDKNFLQLNVYHHQLQF